MINGNSLLIGIIAGSVITFFSIVIAIAMVTTLFSQDKKED